MPASLYMDVHVPRAVTNQLRRRGVDVLTANEDGAALFDDESFLSRATQLRRVLGTQDIRFHELHGWSHSLHRYGTIQSIVPGSKSMTIHVDAIYERGAFRPARPVKLEEGAQVVLTIETGPTETGSHVAPVGTATKRQFSTPMLSREGSLLVLCGSAPLTLDDVNEAIDIGRNERLTHIAGETVERQ